MRYIGVDLHKTNFVVCFLSEDDKTMIETFTLDPKGLARFKRRLHCEDKLAVEASANTFYFCRQIKDRVSEIAVADTYRFAVIHCERSRFIGPDDYLFCDLDGRPYTYDHLTRCVLIPAFDKAEIERQPYVHGFHLFRHSAATLLDEITEGLRAGQGLPGHASEGQTAEYTHRQQTIESSELLAKKFVSCGLTVVKNNETIQ